MPKLNKKKEPAFKSEPISRADICDLWIDQLQKEWKATGTTMDVYFEEKIAFFIQLKQLIHESESHEYVKQYELNEKISEQKHKEQEEEMIELKKIREEFQRQYEEFIEKRKEINALMNEITQLNKQLDQIWKEQHDIVASMIVNLDSMIEVPLEKIFGAHYVRDPLNEENNKIKITMRELQQRIIRNGHPSKRKDDKEMTARDIMHESIYELLNEKIIGFALIKNEQDIERIAAEETDTTIKLDPATNTEKMEMFDRVEKRRVAVLSQIAEKQQQLIEHVKASGEAVEPIIQRALIVKEKIESRSQEEVVDETPSKDKVVEEKDLQRDEKTVVYSLPAKEKIPLGQINKEATNDSKINDQGGGSKIPEKYADHDTTHKLLRTFKPSAATSSDITEKTPVIKKKRERRSEKYKKQVHNSIDDPIQENNSPKLR